MGTSAKPDPNEPFDRAVIEELRRVADLHLDTPYERCPLSINWLWWNRMVATMERGLPR